MEKTKNESETQELKNKELEDENQIVKEANDQLVNILEADGQDVVKKQQETIRKLMARVQLLESQQSKNWIKKFELICYPREDNLPILLSIVNKSFFFLNREYYIYPQ